MGGGLAGMSTAYELGKLGYDVAVLEARMRPGGRCHTIRRGTQSEEEGSTQVCTFDDGLYYNPGPMRIPHHHTATLGYCRELGVPVEVFVNDNESAYLYQTNATALDGQRLRGREVRADLSGYTAELLAKAVSSTALDQELTDIDREALIEYLGRAGGLERSRYKGTARRGYATPPGAATVAGTPSQPLSLDDLLDSRTGLYLQTEYLQQAPMFQVVGGNDRLAAGFAAKLGPKIVYGAAVTEIRQTGDGVEIVYLRDGQPQTIRSRYGVCAMPLNHVSKLPVADIAPDLKAAIATLPYSQSGKIGLQFKRRFWEEDDQIFGGISRTDQEITQIVYPSSGYLGRKGVLVGYYQSGPRANDTAVKGAREREALALAQGQKVHPQYPERVRDLVLGLVAERRLEQGRLGHFSGRRAANRISAAARTRPQPLLRRRPLQLPDGMDGRSAGIGTARGEDAAHARRQRAPLGGSVTCASQSAVRCCRWEHSSQLPSAWRFRPA